MGNDVPPRGQNQVSRKNCFEVVTSAARDWITHVIALGIVGTSLLLISRELWSPTEAKVELAQGIASIVGPWVGVIIGFYFGTRSGEKQAEAASTQADTSRLQRDVAYDGLKGIRTTTQRDSLEQEQRIEGIESRIRKVVDEIADLTG